MGKFKFCIPVLAIALTGMVFTTTSCVDDSESQSVTDLRGAKASQLQAEAELAKAQAEAARIKANAEAAFMAAQAKQAEAEAKKAEAEAAYLEAQTTAEKEKWAVELEKAKEELRQAKAEADLAIEQAKIALDQAKLEAQVKMRQLQDELDKLDANDEVLAEAIAKYSQFISEVTNLTTSIAKDKLDLAKLEALKADKTASEEEQAASLIKAKNQSIESFNKSIDQNTIQIANWNVLLAKGTVNAEEEIAKLQKQIDDLKYNKSVDLKKVYDAAIAAKNEANDAVQDFRNLGTVRTTSWSTVGGYYDSYNVLYNVDYYTVADLNIRITNWKGYIAANEKDLADLEKDYADAEKDQQKLYDDMVAKEKAKDDAYDKYLKVSADPASTPAQITEAWDAYTVANTAYGTATTAYNTAQNIVNTYPLQIINLKNSIESDKATVADWEIALAAYAKDSEAPRKLEAAYITAYKAMIDAQDAYNEVYNEISALNDMIDDLKYIKYLNGTEAIEDIKRYIANLETANENLTNNIAQANRDINEITANKSKAIAMLDVDIKDLKARIAADEVELAAAQKQADSAKAVIDARSK